MCDSSRTLLSLTLLWSGVILSNPCSRLETGRYFQAGTAFLSLFYLSTPFLTSLNRFPLGNMICATLRSISHSTPLLSRSTRRFAVPIVCAAPSLSAPSPSVSPFSTSAPTPPTGLGAGIGAGLGSAMGIEIGAGMGTGNSGGGIRLIESMVSGLRFDLMMGVIV